jgi:hypothetical protein
LRSGRHFVIITISVKNDSPILSNLSPPDLKPTFGKRADQKQISTRNDGYLNPTENACARRVHREAKRSVWMLFWVDSFLGNGLV